MNNSRTPSYQLDMIYPCHKNWDKMSATEKGRYCTSCKKEVVDLTNLSNEALNEAISTQTHSFCGRIESTHLNSIAQPKHTSFKRYVASTLMLFGLAWLLPKNSEGQVIDISKTKDKNDLEAIIKFKDDTAIRGGGNINIQGTLKDRVTHESLAFVTVVVRSNGNVIGGAVSDIHGNFSLDVATTSGALIEVKMTSLGFEPVTIDNIVPGNINLVVGFLKSHMAFYGVIVVNNPPAGKLFNDGTESGSTLDQDDIKHSAW